MSLYTSHVCNAYKPFLYMIHRLSSFLLSALYPTGGELHVVVDRPIPRVQYLANDVYSLLFFDSFVDKTHM